jgi:hypothetical protein
MVHAHESPQVARSRALHALAAGTPEVATRSWHAEVEDVLEGSAPYAVACARAEAFVDALPSGCVNLAVLDPPYFGMKAEAWDHAWANEEAFLAWMDAQCARWSRVLAPNGTLYVFAGTQATRRGATMASRVWA